VASDASKEEPDPLVVAQLEALRDWRGQSFSDEEIENLASILEPGERVSHMSYVKRVKLPGGEMKVAKPAVGVFQPRHQPILAVTDRRLIVQVVGAPNIISGHDAEKSVWSVPFTDVAALDQKKSLRIKLKTKDGSKVSINPGIGTRRRTFDLLLTTLQNR
jgi:hypothetical protein